MAIYDQKVAAELGLGFIDAKMQDTATYRKYRKILLRQYPTKAGMGWPTYLLCESCCESWCEGPDDSFRILGELKGGCPQGEFRRRLQDLLSAIH